MASINVGSKTPKSKTHNGAPARAFTPLDELRRTLFACFLWEEAFYETGNDTAARLATLIREVEPKSLADTVLEARVSRKIRHAPLYMITEMSKYADTKKFVRKLCRECILRPDDATELFALHWKSGKKSIPASMKRGTADAMKKFTKHQLQKYQNKGEIKLIDVFNLAHPKPSKEMEKVWKAFVDGKLEPAVTWETRLSAEGNTKEVWNKLLDEKAVGPLALLRNLRNMKNAGVEHSRIRNVLAEINSVDLLPTAMLAAANHNPEFEKEIEDLFLRSFAQKPKLAGRTSVLIDVSGSMDDKLSERSELTRMDSAMGIAMILEKICSGVEIFTFSNDLVRVPQRRGFALKDAIKNSQHHGCTNLGHALTELAKISSLDRLVVVTDEQSSDEVPAVVGERAYMINVGTYSKGVSFGDWTRINGFSDAVIDFIAEMEKPGGG